MSAEAGPNARAGFAFAMLESTRPAFISSGAGVAGEARHSVATLDGCVMQELFSHTNAATRRVLARNGYRHVQAAGQQCCGALHAHAGDQSRAKDLARRNIAAAGVDLRYTADRAERLIRALKATEVLEWMLLEALDSSHLAPRI